MLYDSARQIKRDKYIEAQQNMEIDAKNQIEAERWNAERERNIQIEKDRRLKANHTERLKRVRKAQDRKNKWFNNNKENLERRANTERVIFFRHRSHSRCATQPPGMYWGDWGAKAYDMHCGHDEVSAMTVPQFAILDIWQHTGRTGTHRRVYGGPNGPKHYPIEWFYANGLNDEISSSEVHIDVPKLTTHLNALKAMPLSKFGINLVVEGQMAPGIDANTTEVPSGWNPPQPK